MDALRGVAGRHGLALIEDAAQAHGALYRGRRVGSLGDAGCFSLNYTKNLPTCGEGGLLTTDDADLAADVTRRRQFGESFVNGGRRDYVSEQLGWNHKLNCIQAAFTRSQLVRFPDYDRRRKVNIERMLARLAALPGILTPSPPAGSTHAYHILRLRFSPERAGLEGVAPSAFRDTVQKVLRAEGVPLSVYQRVSLAEHPAFAPGGGWAGDLPWSLGGRRPQPDTPVCERVLADSLTLQRRHLNPDTGPLLERYATAFEKVWEHLDVLAALSTASEGVRAR
jgi:dTDP-4-amino-4,6-dideoxygalactose transaminase